MPRFYYELATAYFDNNNYESKKEEIYKKYGKEDGNYIVDKYSGYIIENIKYVKEIKFDEENILYKMDNDEDRKDVVTRNRSSSQLGLMNVPVRDISESLDSLDDEDDNLPLGTFDLSRLKSAITTSMPTTEEEEVDKMKEVDANTEGDKSKT